MDFKTHLKKYLTDTFIDELVSSLEKERTNFLILNTNKMSENEFVKLFPKVIKHNFIKNGFYFDKKDYDFGKSFYFDNGLFYILDSASCLVSYLLDVNDGENILDMCAAPGGKTICLSLKNKNVQILSNDISYQRALILSSNIEKLGLSNIIVSSNNIDILENHYNSTFDKIILDAPCSGSAMFRKSEDMKNDWTYNKVLSCQKTQKDLLKKASKMLKPGGIISYSTCSFSFEENEEVILDFLSKNKDFSIVKIEDFDGFYHSESLPEAIHIFPNKFKGEGQFICQIKKDGILAENKHENTKMNPYGFASFETIDNREYLYNSQLNLKKLTILRKGLLLNDIIKGRKIPTFHYAHYLDSNKSISLDEEELKKYLHGDEIKKITNLENGYYVVSYNNINLGFVHVVNDKLKNLYPKGLRH